ncbi:deoxyribose-phosphate aldolase [Vallitalea guaymasensis]|uniref:deoxyribose-phosphate aldolase n=1 Tax=Vallitalea guaymasensis TaxID=1185412 RepID=UPI00272C0A1F|nr:deoxyribose-phosphate aldolase [Vallitalea guaymasensis]
MNIASYIDHTILKPDATKEQVIKICEEAKEYKFASVCVNAFRTKLVKEKLQGSDVKVCTVVGFPLGAVPTEVKAFETKLAIDHGANEIDMVINIGALKDKDYDYVYEDIKGVVDACKNKALVKVIIETCLLTDEEKVKVCELSVKAGAEFVKTSTGFSKGGATVEDVSLMKKTVEENAKVKASGGVRDYETAKAVIDAGADRIGASAGIAIVEGSK